MKDFRNCQQGRRGERKIKRRNIRQSKRRRRRDENTKRYLSKKVLSTHKIHICTSALLSLSSSILENLELFQNMSL
jgi:hypothetical protein